MSIDSVEMLKKVTLFDAGITLISLIISILFFREYTSVVIIGIAISIVNFLLNTVATSYSMKLKWGAFLVLAGSLVRLALAGGFAVFLYRGNILNVVAYITGYSLHYVAIILGVMTNLHKNRGKVNQ